MSDGRGGGRRVESEGSCRVRCRLSSWRARDAEPRGAARAVRAPGGRGRPDFVHAGVTWGLANGWGCRAGDETKQAPETTRGKARDREPIRGVAGGSVERDVLGTASRGALASRRRRRLGARLAARGSKKATERTSHPTRRSRRTSRARGPCPSRLSTWWPCSPPPPAPRRRETWRTASRPGARTRARTPRRRSRARGHSAQPPLGWRRVGLARAPRRAPRTPRARTPSSGNPTGSRERGGEA